MYLSELFEKAGIESKILKDIEILGISCDSRKIKAGFLFIAVAGNKEDGTRYINSAIENGAVAVLCEKAEETFCVPVFVVDNLRLRMALLGDAFYQKKPQNLVAVTGTNGKTSSVFFVREILQALGKKSASIGTLGVQADSYQAYAGMTTADSLTLSYDLAQLADKGVEYVALEASSHGLDQDRLSAQTFKASAFTNLTRDHLDYHGTMENYLQAKMRLFLELTEKTAVLNADIDVYSQMRQACLDRGLKVISYGRQKSDIQLLSQELYTTGQRLKLKIFNQEYDVNLPIAGSFQGINLLTAIGLVIALGFGVKEIISVLDCLKSPAGRMELVATTKEGAGIFVDYAHTPDGLENALSSLKEQVRGRLIVVFGCGGNRDKGKRPQMGKIACDLADEVIITDDNPRFENADEIRSQVLAGCPGASEIGDRAQAILEGIKRLKKEDILLIAGKGHEEGQLINGYNYPFNDKVEAQKALRSLENPLLWTQKELTCAIQSEVKQNFEAYGVSIDSRTIQPGDIYVALIGENTDGHKYVKEALNKGAVLAIVSQPVTDVMQKEQVEKLLFVKDTQQALIDLAKYRVSHSQACRIGITGSSGKTTSKEMLIEAFKGQGTVHATKGNLNNMIGVPLTLANMPPLADIAIIEMGMNHFEEMAFLSSVVQPDVVMITMIGSAHHAFFPTIEDIARAKSEIFQSMNKQGSVFLNKDNTQYDLLKQYAQENQISHIYSFGKAWDADIKLVDFEIEKSGITAQIAFKEKDYTLKLNTVGKHYLQNALGVLGIVKVCGKSIEKAISNLLNWHPLKGRGVLLKLIIEGKNINYIDDCYNANPSSMEAGLDVLGFAKKRKIAILGDMRELGDKSILFHQGLLPVIEKNKIDKVICVGEEMRALFEVLPNEKRAGFVKEAKEAVAILKALLQEGDTILVKGSHSLHLETILEDLQK